MAKSYSKLRHIQESNKKLESSYFKKRDILTEGDIGIVDDFVTLMGKLLGKSYNDGLSILNKVEKGIFFDRLKTMLADFGEYAGVAGVKAIDNVDDLIKAMQKSQVLATHVFESIFNTPALRAEYEMRLLKSLGETPVMKGLEKSVLTGNLDVVRQVKNVYLKTTSITSDMLDKLISSFARKNKISLSEFDDMPNWVLSKYVFSPENNDRLIKNLLDKTKKLENLYFDAEKIELINKAVYHSDDLLKNGAVVRVEREVLELKLPTGDNIIVYKSAGIGQPEIKQLGDWQVIPGFNTNPYNPKGVSYFIKNPETAQLTQGKNIYLTKLDDWLKKNGTNSFGDKAFHYKGTQEFPKFEIPKSVENPPVDKSNARKMSHGGYAGSD